MENYTPSTDPIELSPRRPGRAWELLAYMEKRSTGARAPVVQADITGNITWTTYDVTDYDAELTADERTLVATGSVALVDTISDTLLSGTVWTQGGDGFNVTAAIPSTALPTGNKKYLLRLTYTLTTSGPQDDWFLVRTLDVPVP